MIPTGRDGDRQLRLATPVVVLILAFTAVPAELRSSGEGLAQLVEPYVGATDVAANLLGYVPVGALGAISAPSSVLAVAAATSALAETTQLFTEERTPSPVDFLANVAGAAIGWLISRRRRIFNTGLRIGNRLGLAAGAIALSYLFIGTGTSPQEIEDAIAAFSRRTLVAVHTLRAAHGRTAAIEGLEARWTFDDGSGSVARDSSGNGRIGLLVNNPVFAMGVHRSALQLSAVNQYVEVADAPAMRSSGSVTITAWINISSHPVDDAAIVSSLGDDDLGYQLDTTVDQGARTVAFKLANASGRLMARYGTTPLAIGAWYHVAGVYDAEARALNVYLNGQVDNGCLLGAATRVYTPGTRILVGSRPARWPSSFAGSLDDVTIYSRAVRQPEIEMEMRAAPALAKSSASSADHGVRSERLQGQAANPTCPPDVTPDPRVAGVVVTFGMLVAIACVGLWRTPNYRASCALMSLSAGFVLAPFIPSTMPTYYPALVPLLTLAGGAAVVAAVRQGGASWRDDGGTSVRD